jgi:misacylated tRNA(Ala) deacylase
MMNLIFQSDPYARTAPARVIAHTADGGIIVDACLFYATGGGQPGDSGNLLWDGNDLEIATATKTPEGFITLVPGPAGDPVSALPPIGTQVTQSLNWDHRFGNMRVHTALHLLSVVFPLPVTGGSISFLKGRLDFNMPDSPPDKAAPEAALQALIDRDLPVTESWITEEELAANPGLVKTMSVSPPRGAGRIRLVRIGEAETQVDLQPCGGTHVGRTGEIGRIRLGKIEKKGRRNRRVYLHLAG